MQSQLALTHVLHEYNMHVPAYWEIAKVLVRSCGPSYSSYWLCHLNHLLKLSESSFTHLLNEGNAISSILREEVI